MRPLRHPLAPAAAVAGAALLTTGVFSLSPAAAQSLRTLAALVVCNSSSPCASWQNKGSGNAIEATAAQGDGVRAYSSGKNKAGVYGEADSSSGGYGVHGSNASPSGIAVYATGGSGTGLSATGIFGVSSTTSSGYGVFSQATTGVGVEGYSSAGYGVVAASNSGIALYSSSSSASSDALYASNYATSSNGMFAGDGAHLLSYAANGAVIANGYYTQNGIDAVVGNDSVRFGEIVGGRSFGLIATTGAGTGGYPLEAASANSSGSVTGFFYVDGAGSVHYTGTLQSYARTRGGANVTAYETKSTQAAVEDSGSAQLVAGSAVVHLDPNFAQAIDLTSPYRVFLTPQGDTRGLYIAQKTAGAFVVRETQGGRGTFAFDYRILATAAGHAAERMIAVTPDVAARAFPMLKANAGTNAFTGIRTAPNVAKPLAP